MQTQMTTVSILAEIPEDLHQAVVRHLETHIDWDQDRLFVAALSFFLLQNEDSDRTLADDSIRQAARVYLDRLFEQTA